jgi:hypothetical protein
MKKIKWKIVIFLFMLSPMTLGAIFPIYTEQMLLHGWDIRYSTVSAQNLEGYAEPTAKKLKDGSLEFNYSVRVDYLGWAGEIASPIVTKGIEKRTKVVRKEDLVDFNIALEGSSANTQYIWNVAKEIALAKETIPKKEYVWEDQGLILPDEECFIWMNGYYWYLPATVLNEKPKMAFIQTETYETPRMAFFYRAVSLPFALFLDGVLNPFHWIASKADQSVF